MEYLPSALRPQGRDRVRHVEDGLSGSTLQHPPGLMQVPQHAPVSLLYTPLPLFRF